MAEIIRFNRSIGEGVDNRYIIKFCDQKYLVSKTSYIRLGSLSNFRNHENEALKDEFEGRKIVDLCFYGTVVSEQWFFDVVLLGNQEIIQFLGRGAVVEFHRNTVITHLSTAGIPAAVHANFEKLHIDSINGGLQRRLTGTVQFELIFDDFPIFCTSMGPWSMTPPFAGYNSRWGVPFSNIDLLKRFLVSCYWDSIVGLPLKHSVMGECQLLPRSAAEHSAYQLEWANGVVDDLVSVEVELDHGPVSYSKRTLNVSNEFEIGRDKIAHEFSRAVFQKPEDFRHEAEYRFVFKIKVFRSSDEFAFLYPQASVVDLRIADATRAAFLSSVSEEQE